MNSITPAARDVLKGLPLTKTAALAPFLTPAARIDRRDAAIRDALAYFYADTPKTPAALAMATELRAGNFDGSRKAETLVAILALNKGRPIGWRQIVNIVDNVHG